MEVTHLDRSRPGSATPTSQDHGSVQSPPSVCLVRAWYRRTPRAPNDRLAAARVTSASLGSPWLGSVLIGLDSVGLRQRRHVSSVGLQCRDGVSAARPRRIDERCVIADGHSILNAWEVLAEEQGCRELAAGASAGLFVDGLDVVGDRVR